MYQTHSKNKLEDKSYHALNDLSLLGAIQVKEDGKLHLKPFSLDSSSDRNKFLLDICSTIEKSGARGARQVVNVCLTNSTCSMPPPGFLQEDKSPEASSANRQVWTHKDESSLFRGIHALTSHEYQTLLDYDIQVIKMRDLIKSKGERELCIQLLYNMSAVIRHTYSYYCGKEIFCMTTEGLAALVKDLMLELDTMELFKDAHKVMNLNQS